MSALQLIAQRQHNLYFIAALSLENLQDSIRYCSPRFPTTHTTFSSIGTFDDILLPSSYGSVTFLARPILICKHSKGKVQVFAVQCSLADTKGCFSISGHQFFPPGQLDSFNFFTHFYLQRSHKRGSPNPISHIVMRGEMRSSSLLLFTPRESDKCLIRDSVEFLLHLRLTACRIENVLVYVI